MDTLRNASRASAVLACLLGLAGCVVAPPSGPTVMALPKQGGDFTAFQNDDMGCRAYAGQLGGGPATAQAANNQAVGGAVAGTALGAGAGAALGSLSGNAGAGAVVGGLAGLAVGSSVGANNAAATMGYSQHDYDVHYTQCMLARGYQVQSAAPGGYPGYAAYPYPAPYPYVYPEVEVGVGGFWGPRWHRW